MQMIFKHLKVIGAHHHHTLGHRSQTNKCIVSVSLGSDPKKISVPLLFSVSIAGAQGQAHDSQVHCYMTFPTVYTVPEWFSVKYAYLPT